MAERLSVAERRYVEDGLLHDVRNDGRSRLDFRPIVLQSSLIPQASGSARLKLGGTDVLVGVKVEIGVPAASQPGNGRVEFCVEVASTVSPVYQGRGGEQWGAELTASLQQCFGGSPSGAGAAFPPSSLGIIPGRTCWVLYVDAVVLAADGAVLDALALATKAAFADTRVPKLSVVEGQGVGDEADFEVDEDPRAATQLPLDGVPVVITLRQSGQSYFVDATSAEESLAQPGLSVAVNAKGEVCGVVKVGRSSLDAATLHEMLQVSQRLATQLHAAVDAHVAIDS